MNTKALTMGYYSAGAAAISFIAYTVCFAAILWVNPLFVWTNYENYIQAMQTTNQTFKHIAMFFMLVFGASYVILLCSIGEIVETSRKYYAKIGQHFGVGFFTLIGINYFVQVTAVRLQISADQVVGLEQFVQENPISVLAAINMLGWTVFFGLSSVFLSLSLQNVGKEKGVRRWFMANGVIMGISGVAYAFDISIVVFLGMFIGMGVAVLLSTLCACRLFKSLKT